MSWLGNWVGKYLGNWLGGQGGNITISATPLLLALSSPAATEATGAKHTATPLNDSFFIVSPVVKFGLLLHVGRLDTTLTLTAPTIGTNVAINPYPLTLASQIVPPTVSIKVNVIATPLTVALTVPTPILTWGAITNAATIDITLIAVDADAITGAIATVDALDVFITVVVPKVYDRTGSILYPASLTMKINIPEIIAFSTDITTDMQVIDAMGDDMSSMDGTQSVKLLRKTDNIVISLVDGTAIPENKIYTFENALIRQIADRDNRAVKQLRLFMQSVQNDDFATVDTIIELPIRTDVQILTGDIIQSDLQGTKYDVIAVDTCTLKTRWRVGARKFI